MPDNTEKQDSRLDRMIVRHKRRGFLELDIILDRFFTSCYAHLSLENKRLLLELLQFSDIDLLSWVTKAKEAAPQYQPLVKLLSNCKYSTHDTSDG